jgi:hypothetical protein
MSDSVGDGIPVSDFEGQGEPLGKYHHGNSDIGYRPLRSWREFGKPNSSHDLTYQLKDSSLSIDYLVCIQVA